MPAVGISLSHPPLGIAMGVTAQQPLQCGVQVEGQLCVVRVPRFGKRAYHYQATGGEE
ncbi:hypothetical protein SCOCK_200133 [Actinacidiphila cocklensis]|uniref:Uncharacterized protein n=1 Tax=Actinacidiphila cocklensis TaxID=887465 RepID=A0A9W4DNT4_9ACTN|nr:hypothetical protein SCOCK_200133 [Actinacidiphila cocklensis]